MFVTVDTDEDDHRRVIEFLGLKGEPLPTMRIIQVGTGFESSHAKMPQVLIFYHNPVS